MNRSTAFHLQSTLNCITSTHYNEHYCLASNYSRGAFLSCLKIFSPPSLVPFSLSFVSLSGQHFKGPNMSCLQAFCPPLPQNIGFNPVASYFGHLLYDIYDIFCPASKYLNICPASKYQDICSLPPALSRCKCSH